MIPLSVTPCPELAGADSGVSVVFLGLFVTFLFVDLAVNARALFASMGIACPNGRVIMDHTS
jgi:hypothetical protein